MLHPNVEEDIDSDLELMRLAANYLDKFGAVRGFRYLNVEGAIDEFSSLLKLQLDLRTEGANLVRFNKNFCNVDEIAFPKVRDDLTVRGCCLPDSNSRSFCSWSENTSQEKVS